MTTASPDTDVEVRRPLTVVFVDIVGSTPLSIVMDGEDYAALIADYRQIADEVVERHGGFVPKDEGDGRFIWFGWPTARRDDAQRAVAFSRDLVASTEVLSRQAEADTGRPLSLRIGIHSGPAIVSATADHETADVSSAAVNFAAKVQQAAEPGAILITEATVSQMLEPFEIEPEGTVSIDQLPGAIDVYRVVGPPRRRAEIGPFIGREDELVRLCDGWKTVREGGSASIVITGATGLGKSSLVDEFRRRAGLPASAEVQGDIDRTTHPLEALQPALRSVLGHSADLQAATSLGLDDEVAADALRAAGLSPLEDRQAEAVAAARDVFEAAAATDALLVVVDDAQWLDASSAEVLASLASDPCPGLMIVLTARHPLDEPPWPPLESMPLTGLAADDAHELVGRLDIGVSDDEQRARIIERAAGNPFFLVWLSRTDDAGYEGVRRLLRPRSGVPAVVQQAVRSQIDGAGVSDDVTSMAAVIGMEFTTELLAAALDREVADLQPALAKLTDHDIVRPPAGDAHRFRFTHSLVRDLAYDLLLEYACQQRHGRVADVLEGRGSDDHAAIGQHHDRAGRPLPAARAKLAAARGCRQSSAYREGAALVDRVVELVEDETSDLPADIEVEARELHAIFAASVDPGSYIAGTSDSSRVLELLDPEEEVRRVVMAKTRDWAGAMMTGDLRTSIRLLYEVRRIGQDRFPEIMVCNRNARGTHAGYRGRYAVAERLLGDSTDQMEREGIDSWLEDNWATPDDPVALAHSYVPPVLFQRGRKRAAEKALERAWRRAETVPGGAHTLAHVGSNAAIYWELAGDGPEALRLGEQVAEIGRELHLEFWEVNGKMHARLGEALIEPTPALLEHLEGQATLLDTFVPMAAGRVHMHVANLWLRLADPDRATDSLDAVRDSSVATGMNYLDAEEQRLRASTLDGKARTAALVGAAALADRQGARRFRIRTLTDLAEIEPGIRVDGVTVADALDAAIADFPEPDDDVDIEQAVAVREATVGG